MVNGLAECMALSFVSWSVWCRAGHGIFASFQSIDCGGLCCFWDFAHLDAMPGLWTADEPRHILLYQENWLVLRVLIPEHLNKVCSLFLVLCNTCWTKVSLVEYISSFLNFNYEDTGLVWLPWLLLAKFRPKAWFWAKYMFLSEIWFGLFYSVG
jgi:hypothetical protein